MKHTVRPPGNPRKWLRRLHAWGGLALAGLALFFALTGFLLNHRAVLKIPALDKRETVVVLPLAEPPPSPEALALLAGARFGVAPGDFRSRLEASRNAEWSGVAVRQPEQWVLSADRASRSLRVEYWVGGRQAEVRLSSPNLWLHLARLHMAIGAGPAWVLLSDLLALGLAGLAISGFWLWGRLHGSPRRLAAIAGGGALLLAVLGWLAG